MYEAKVRVGGVGGTGHSGSPIIGEAPVVLRSLPRVGRVGEQVVAGETGVDSHKAETGGGGEGG